MADKETYVIKKKRENGKKHLVEEKNLERRWKRKKAERKEKRTAKSHQVRKRKETIKT